MKHSKEAILAELNVIVEENGGKAGTVDTLFSETGVDSLGHIILFYDLSEEYGTIYPKDDEFTRSIQVIGNTVTLGDIVDETYRRINLG